MIKASHPLTSLSIYITIQINILKINNIIASPFRAGWIECRMYARMPRTRNKLLLYIKFMHMDKI